METLESVLESMKKKEGMPGISKEQVIEGFQNNLADHDTAMASLFNCEFRDPQKLFLTGQSFTYLNALDKTFIGTACYLGFAYFWGQEYKHTLRSANNAQRQRVHMAFIKADLDLTGASPQHKAIVEKYCKGVRN